jgi:hypothetical protein
MHFNILQTFATVSICFAAITAGGAPASAQSPAVASLFAWAPGGNVPQLESDVLGAVPENAYGVVLGANVLESKATVEKVLRKLNIPFDQGDDYAEFTQFLEGLRGWDNKSLHAMAFVPGAEEDDVEIVLFVPVTSYKEFASSLGADDDSGATSKFKTDNGPDGYIASKGSIAVLVESGDEELLAKIVASRKGVGDVGTTMRAWVGKHQVAGIILPAGLAKIFDEVIDGIDKLKKEVPGEQAAMVAGVFDIYSDLIKAGRDEVTLFAMGARLDEQSGLDWAMQANFRPGGKLAEASKEISPLPTNPLRGLPEGEFFVAGAGIIPQNWMKGLMDFSLGMTAKVPKDLGGYELTPEEAEEIAEATAQAMTGMKTVSLSMGLTGKTFFDRMYGIIKVDDSAKFLENYEKSFRRVEEIAKKNPKSGYPAPTIERKKIGGRDVIVATTDVAALLKQAQAQGQPGFDATKMIQQLMFGGDKLVGYITVADDQTVVMTYHEESITVLADDVKQGKTGLADDVQIKAAAALLPAEAHWVGYMNVGGYMELVKKFMGAAMAANGAPNFLPPIPPFPDAPPVGFSAKVNPTSLEGHIVVPMGLAEAVRDYITQMQGVLGGGLR